MTPRYQPGCRCSQGAKHDGEVYFETMGTPERRLEIAFTKCAACGGDFDVAVLGSDVPRQQVLDHMRETGHPPRPEES